MLTVLLLIVSNVFMVIAWYGHLKFKETPLLSVIFVSWGIAFFEYCFQVPANRYGHGQFTTTQLKVIQMIVTLVVFSIFVVTYMGEPLAWNHLVAFVLLVAAGFFVFGFESPTPTIGGEPMTNTDPMTNMDPITNTEPSSDAKDVVDKSRIRSEHHSSQRVE